MSSQTLTRSNQSPRSRRRRQTLPDVTVRRLPVPPGSPCEAFEFTARTGSGRSFLREHFGATGPVACSERPAGTAADLMQAFGIVLRDEE
jgi:hypothetical protein